jgi:nicotinamide-nucleotide adenylyltransferase
MLRETVNRGLFVGRFQPMHIGHLEVIKSLLKILDELVIVIGSSQRSHEPDNPFTSGERIMMIRASLNEVGMNPSKYYLIPVPDVQNHSTWVSQVISSSPPFMIVYSNDALTRRLFHEAGVKVENIPFINRGSYSSTEVRRRILAGEDWKILLPKPVPDIIVKLGGVERLKALATSDALLKKNVQK